jgi:hypothetical protein
MFGMRSASHPGKGAPCTVFEVRGIKVGDKQLIWCACKQPVGMTLSDRTAISNEKA